MTEKNPLSNPRHTWISCVIMAIMLTACGVGPVITPTEIATQLATEAPVVETTQAPATQESNAPSMENLPAEWQGKIDRVETMKNMDGTERIVAILKGEDPNEESKLRTLQWDGKEWVSYVPQVGWAGWGPVDSYTSYWDKEALIMPDRESLTQLTLSDGTKLPWGELGTIFMSKKMENGLSITFAQGVILDIVEAPPRGEGDTTKPVAVYTGFPLKNGDWQVYVSVQRDFSDKSTGDVVKLSTLTLSDFGKYAGETQLSGVSRLMTDSEMRSWLQDHSEEMVGQSIIQGIITDPSIPTLTGPDIGSARFNFVNGLKSGEVCDIANISTEFTPIMASDDQLELMGLN